MPNDMSTIMIVSAKAAANATTEDFNTGKATIGTGPFRFVRWQKGDRIELARNNSYWGRKYRGESNVPHHHLRPDPGRLAAGQ